MNSTPPHFTWRPRLSNATRQSLSARVGRLKRGLAFRGRLLLVFVEHVLVAPRELLFELEPVADREAPPSLGTELVEAVRGFSRDGMMNALGASANPPSSQQLRVVPS